jgi:hypothetical protein
MSSYQKIRLGGIGFDIAWLRIKNSVHNPPACAGLEQLEYIVATHSKM